MISTYQLAGQEKGNKGHGSEKTDDNTYGKGGGKTIIYDTTELKDGSKEYCIRVVFTDPKGKDRETKDTCRNDRSDKNIKIIHETWERQNNGDETHSYTEIRDDDLGYETVTEKKWKLKAGGTGYKQTSGYIKDGGKTYTYQPETGEYLDSDGKAYDLLKQFKSNISLPQNNIPKFELAACVGYGLSLNPGQLEQNKIFTANNRSFDGLYGSWAKGENLCLRPTFRLCHSMSAGVELDYIYGKKYLWTTNTIGATSTTNQLYHGRYHCFSFTPFMMINPCEYYGWTPYAEIGPRFNLCNSICESLDQTQISNNITTTSKQVGELRGLRLTTGFDAVLGVKHRIGKNWGLCGEIYSINNRFTQDEWTLKKYTVNETDQFSTLNTSQKQINYVKNYTTPTSTTDPNSPLQSLRDPQSASSIGIRLGISHSF
ncbi:MAG: hypothetical protein ACHQEB_01320 [Chitinophagales bacterium]